MQVHVEHAFFHCSKAYMRARLWEPASWPAERYKVCFGPYFHRSQARSDALDAAVQTHYDEVAQAVRGERAEPD